LQSITLPSGMEVTSRGRCTGSFCTATVALAVTLKSSDGTREYGTRGKCQEHVDRQYLSAEDYAQRTAAYRGNGLALGVFERDRYEIRPLTEKEAAEVAYEAAAPERWAKEGTIGVMRRIVADHAAEEIDGVLVDLFSASAVVKVYDALKAESQAKMRGMDVVRMVEISFRLLSDRD
jgi:hypothetical protein